MMGKKTRNAAGWFLLQLLLATLLIGCTFEDNIEELRRGKLKSGTHPEPMGGTRSYVSLDLSGSTFDNIEPWAFSDCTSLASVTIPDSVTSIGDMAFYGCTSLTRVTFEGTIPSTGFSSPLTFPGDLRDKFYETDPANGTPGTYTRNGNTWTKQP
jgi:hypothetical protein